MYINQYYLKIVFSLFSLVIVILLLSSKKEHNKQNTIKQTIRKPTTNNKLDNTQDNNKTTKKDNKIETNFIKCNKKKAGTILDTIFKNNNIKRKDHSENNWDLYIPCGYNNVEKELKNIKIKHSNQKIFGISGCDSIASKNNLWNLLNNKYGREIAKTIMPETYILNKTVDITLFRKRYNKNNIYILKKNIQNKKGLKLTKDLDVIEQAHKDKFKLVQIYIKDVFLINKRKINLRVYLLFVCQNDTTDAYVYKEGKCIYTNKDYDSNNIMDKESNITSYKLNLDIYNDNPFSFEELKIYLDSRDYNSNLLFNRIDASLIKLFHAVKHNLCNLKKLKKNISFQLFGVDIIFDKNLKLYILEINKGPEMKPKNNRDRILKTKLNRDMLGIVNMIETNNNLFYKIA